MEYELKELYNRKTQAGVCLTDTGLDQEAPFEHSMILGGNSFQYEEQMKMVDVLWVM